MKTSLKSLSYRHPGESRDPMYIEDLDPGLRRDDETGLHGHHQATAFGDHKLAMTASRDDK